MRMAPKTSTLHITSNIFKNIFKQNNLLRAMSTTVSSTPSPNPAVSPLNDVIFEDINKAGVITLNRPKALNAINLSMVNQLLPKLQKWETEKSLVLIKGSGEKSFCAGGDVRAVTEAGLRGERTGHDFFRTEYTMNGLIGYYYIPYIALIDGIVMGGGVGLSIHGHYRICTERTMYAMPETAIGLFPDVGGSYVLPKMANKLGYYLALTGARLKGSDVLKAGIATHYIESKRLKSLELALLKCDDHDSVKSVLSKMCLKEIPEFSLKPHLDIIDKCFSKNTVEEILRALEEDGSDFAKETIKLLCQMSPTSLKVSLKLLQNGGKMQSLLECLQMEYRVASACLANHDFYEGVRSVLIDKDKNPKWKPATLKEVTHAIVDSHFKKLPENEELRHKL